MKSSTWQTQAVIGDEMERIGDEIATIAGEEKAMTAMLLFEETFVNIAKYAYEEEKEKPIHITCRRISPEDICLEFTDEGIAFDPTEYIPKIPDGKQIGGHGIRLIKQFAKELKYIRLEEKNLLTIIL